MGKDARNHLLLYLNLGYALLIVYASLYPLTGWHDSGSNPLDFLAAAWPRYYTGFDLAANILAYVPLGFLLRRRRCARLGIAAAALLAALAGAGTQPRTGDAAELPAEPRALQPRPRLQRHRRHDRRRRRHELGPRRLQRRPPAIWQGHVVPAPAPISAWC
jgi:hypothetical protein